MNPPEAARSRTSMRRQGPATTRVSLAVAWTVLAAMLSTIVSVTIATPAQALSPVLLADWEMNEAPGSTVMIDSSGNNINGAIGSAVQVGTFLDGSTGYAWDNTIPTAPPPKPERLVQVNDSRLNPGNRDYAVTVRFRTTRSYGNMIQKGQSQTPGGYFKWEIPSGILMCLFRSRSSNGTLLGEKSVKSPASMPLNDGVWHTVRCEKTVDRVTMTIDGTTTVQSSRGTIGSISNNKPLTIAGKAVCDQVEVTCDYFSGNIDWVHIEAGKTGTDLQPPTTPGQPTGTSNGYTVTDLTWAGSTDNVSSTIQYRVYRDGALVGITASSAATIHYTDTGLAPGSTHTYSILASDLSGNVSPMGPVSAPIQTEVAPLGTFVDDFSGGFTNWNTVTGFTIDGSAGDPSAPSARPGHQPGRDGGEDPAQHAEHGVRELPRQRDVARVQLDPDTAAHGERREPPSRVRGHRGHAAAPLGRREHAIACDGPVGDRGLAHRRGVRDRRDGELVEPLSRRRPHPQSMGREHGHGAHRQDRARRLQRQDVDGELRHRGRRPIGGRAPALRDTSPPTTPGQPAGTSTVAGRIDLTWSASTDQSPPITYRIYRDGGASPVGQTTGTTFSDPGLVNGSVHTYTVDATDALKPRESAQLLVQPDHGVRRPTDSLSADHARPAGRAPARSRAGSIRRGAPSTIPITYRIYRDGGASPVGQTTGTAFSDMGLVAGSVHTYTVDAVDGAEQRERAEPRLGSDHRLRSPAGRHPADHARPAGRHQHVGRADRPDVGRLDRPVATDHLPHLPRRRCEPGRSDDGDGVQRHGPRRRLGPHVHRGRGRRGDERERGEPRLGSDHRLRSTPTSRRRPRPGSRRAAARSRAGST